MLESEGLPPTALELHERVDHEFAPLLREEHVFTLDASLWAEGTVFTFFPSCDHIMESIVVRPAVQTILIGVSERATFPAFDPAGHLIEIPLSPLDSRVA